MLQVTRSRASEYFYPDYQVDKGEAQNAYCNPEHEERIMQEAMKSFKNINQDKLNGNKGVHSSIPNIAFEEFLQFPK
jgi:hypothetical protein